MALKQVLGVDISMDSFDVNLHFLTDDFKKKCVGSRKFENNMKGYNDLNLWVKKRKDDNLALSAVIEFTGVYYECLAHYLRDQRYIVHMVIPSKAKKYIESLSKCSKTDKLDAQSLAWMGLERDLRRWEPISKNFLELRHLTREREELLKEKTIVNNRLHAMKKGYSPSLKAIQRYEERVALIKDQIDDVEADIKMFIKEKPLLNEKVKKIITIPGVGITTAATIIAETNGFSAILNQKQLTSYAGYDVKFNESGKFKGRTKISKQGNAHIRRVLHFPAQTAIIHNAPLSTFYQRVNANKIKPMIGGVAVQRKLLCLTYAIWKTDRVFDPKYEITKTCKKKVGLLES